MTSALLWHLLWEVPPMGILHHGTHSLKHSVSLRRWGGGLLFYKMNKKMQKVLVPKSLKSMIQRNFLGTACSHNFTLFLLCTLQTVAFYLKKKKKRSGWSSVGIYVIFGLVVFLKKRYWGEHCLQTEGEMMPLFMWVLIPFLWSPSAGTAALWSLKAQEFPEAISCPSHLLQHIQLLQQYLLLRPCSSSPHPRADHPFLVGIIFRSSSLRAVATQRNGPCFYMKCVWSRFKYPLNQAFFL